jgi:LacI family transcriptional regulator
MCTMKIVLFFQSTTHKSWRKKLAGLHTYAQRHDWFVHVVEKSAAPEELRNTIKNWSPIGCLVDRAMSHSAPPDNMFVGIPTVYLDQRSDNASKRHPCLLHDNAAEASMVGKELLGLKCASYAYLGTGNDYFWDSERLKQFRKDVQDNGVPFFKLSRRDLKAQINALPKPCGIFGANDACAAEAYHAAVAAGFSIPCDVSVAGIDNDELYCETVSPGITSVEPDFEGAGYHLGEMLEEEIGRMRNRCRTRRRAYIESYGPLRLVRRGSTMVQKGIGPRIQAALEFLRRHACDSGITLDDVVREMKCSRRMATLEFKKATGRTIFDEIHDIRFQKACELLSRTEMPIATIIAQCGYDSDSFIKRMFRERSGMTMREWRKKNGQR